MEIQRVMLCHDAPLTVSQLSHCINHTHTHTHTQFSQSPSSNNHEVGSHAWLSSGRCQQDETGMGLRGGAHSGRSKEGSAEDNQRVIDIKLGKTQSLKPFNALSRTPQGLPVWPQHLFPNKGARCGGDEKPAWVSPPFHRQFPLIHPAFSGSLMDVLTHLPQASGTPSPPPLPIWSSTSRCVNGLIPPASYNQATQKVLDQVELVNSGT